MKQIGSDVRDNADELFMVIDRCDQCDDPLAQRVRQFPEATSLVVPAAKE